MIVRNASRADAADLADLLNEIIAIGGTTAHEDPYSAEAFAEDYLTGNGAVSCQAAFQGHRAMGFQVLGLYPALPDGWLDIGTFVRPAARGAGLGATLFAASLAAVQGKCRVINATIRADNGAGLGYYDRIGFRDYAADPDYRLKDGRVVGRISKRFDLV